MKCVHCGFENAAGARFCGKCGALMGPAPAAKPASAPVAQTLDTTGAKRRDMIILIIIYALPILLNLITICLRVGRLNSTGLNSTGLDSTEFVSMRSGALEFLPPILLFVQPLPLIVCSLAYSKRQTVTASILYPIAGSIWFVINVVYSAMRSGYNNKLALTLIDGSLDVNGRDVLIRVPIVTYLVIALFLFILLLPYARADASVWNRGVRGAAVHAGIIGLIVRIIVITLCILTIMAYESHVTIWDIIRAPVRIVLIVDLLIAIAEGAVEIVICWAILRIPKVSAWIESRRAQLA